MEQGVITHVIAGISAVGSISVAVLAIWGDRVRSLLAGPKLGLELAAPTFTERANRVPTVYHNLKLINRRCWAPAKQVRIVVTALWKRNQDDAFLQLPLSVPLQLIWAYPEWHEVLPTVARDDWCNLGCLDKGCDHFMLTTYVTPNNFQGFVRKGECLRARIEVLAANGEMKGPLDVEMSWDGVWPDEQREMDKHLVVRLAP